MPVTPDEIKSLSANPPPALGRLKYSLSVGKARLAHLQTKFELDRTEPRGLIELNAKLEILDELDAEFELQKAAASAPTAKRQFSVYTPFDATHSAPSHADVATPTMTASAAVPPSGVIAQYNAILDPAERAEFYQRHQAQYDREFRRLPKSDPSAARKSSGIPLVDKMNAIPDARLRTAFYQKNKEAIDQAYRSKNI